MSPNSKNVSDSADSLTAVLGRLFPHGGPKGLILDCDGVLVDSRPAIVALYNKLRAQLDLPPMNREQEEFVIVGSYQQSLEHVIPRALFPALRPLLAAASPKRDMLPYLKLMPQVRELLDQCRAWGMKLGIHTNRAEEMPELLEFFQLQGCFDPVMTVCNAAPKPSSEGTLAIIQAWGLPPQSLLFLGDGTTDQCAAAGAGVPFLAFAQPGLEAAVHCDSYAELLRALAALRDGPGFSMSSNGV